MFRPIRKLIAVLLAIWLPLFGGSALASAVSMQLQHGQCHETAMQKMPQAGAGGHHHAGSPALHHETGSHGQQGSSCNACGIVHLACNAPDIKVLAAQPTDGSVTPYLFSFRSITSTPLLQPPLS